jgi:DNA-binding PadR family transcriptional regulator
LGKQAAENGLGREQIRKLFHCRAGSGSIDQALEKLSSLQLVASRYVIGRGRPATVWFAIDPACVEPTEEEAAEPEESSEEADLPCLPCTF